MCISEGGKVKKQMNKKKKDYKLNLISQNIKLAFISFFIADFEACSKVIGHGICCTLELLKI